MKIGYPCINRSIGCNAAATFRLKSYSERRLVETVQHNLGCLRKILLYNLEHDLLFFRISSDFVPFASHPVCRFDWRRYFGRALRSIGRFVKRNRMRVSMHPDQFTLINAVDVGVFRRSVAELMYHAGLLDAMGLNLDAKIQIHVGGVYGDKEASIRRFIRRYRSLDRRIRRRLVIENDDTSFTVADCLAISRVARIPVLFDVFHHRLNNNGEGMKETLLGCVRTWRVRDGLPLVDYSVQKQGARRGTHADRIDVKMFRRFIAETRPIDYDLMLEIKDKERSSLRAAAVARRDPRFGRARRPG
jgi:UV DNA damage endonuclease